MTREPPRQKRFKRVEWRRLIVEQKGSGQTQVVFCAARGISVGSLQNRKRRLAIPDVTPAPRGGSTPVGMVKDSVSNGSS